MPERTTQIVSLVYGVEPGKKGAKAKPKKIDVKLFEPTRDDKDTIAACHIAYVRASGADAGQALAAWALGTLSALVADDAPLEALTSYERLTLGQEVASWATAGLGSKNA